VTRFTDFFWPTLERPTSTLQESQKQSLDEDINELKKTTWTKESQLALSEARNISEREDERRRSTDAKASNYLLVIAAVIPLLTYLESTVWEQKLGTAPKWLSLPILGIAVVHILWAGHWAFKTLTVQAFSAMDGTNLMEIWSDADPVQSLVRETLITARKNRDTINEKVSSIKMAHIFLKRGMYFFGLLLLVQVGWYLLSPLIPTIWLAIKKVVCSR
jgi:hypothetical protein